jgi:putative tricarboxylic transport membrane protein
MIQRILAGLMIAFGGFAVVDGFRVQANERPDAMFDDIGPDRYIMGLGGVLALIGLLMMFERRPVEALAGGDAERASGVPPYVLLLAITAVYALAIPYVGYTIATIVFLVLAFWIAGVTSLVRSLVYGVVTSALFWWLFVRLTAMPLPRGSLGLLPV